MNNWKSYTASPRIAYFSMEIGLSYDIPTYSGGLGVLAGDTIKSAADLKLPMVAVTLVSPAIPVEGSGVVAQVTFVPLQPGALRFNALIRPLRRAWVNGSTSAAWKRRVQSVQQQLVRALRSARRRATMNVPCPLKSKSSSDANR